MLFAELRMGREEVYEGVQAVLLADSYDSALQPLTRWAASPGDGLSQVRLSDYPGVRGCNRCRHS